MLKRFAALAAALALFMGPAGIAAAAESASPSPTDSVTPAQKLSPYVEPSIVAVSTTWSAKVYDKRLGMYLRDQVFSTSANCTGFVISEDGYIGTAGHCVVTEPDTKYAVMDDALDWVIKNDIYGDNVSVKLLVDYAIQNWRVYAPKARKQGVVDRAVNVTWNANVSGIDVADGLPARVRGQQKFDQGDSALLKVEADDLVPLPLVDEDLETGTEIASVGYPGSVDDVVDVTYTPSVKTGTVSSEKTTGGGLLKVYEVDAAVSPGMSGGPTVNYDGEVVGINSFKPAKESQAFNFIQPTSNLQELLASVGVVAGLGEVGEAYRTGLDAYFAGDKEAAVENLSEVVDLVPSNKFADEYLEKAEDLPDPKPKETDDGLSKTAVFAAIALLVLLALAGVAFYFIRKKRDDGTSSDGPAPLTGVVRPPSSGEASEDDTRPLQQDSKFCGNCGNQATPGTRFCPNCGNSL